MRVSLLTLMVLSCTCCRTPIQQGSGTKQVLLTWQQSGTVDRFNIYRGGHNGEGILTSVPGNTLTYVDPKVQPNKQFCYVVTSVVNSIESQRSNETCVNT